MKKIFYVLAIAALMMGAFSCSIEEDEPKRGDGVFTVNTTMVNHMVNTNSGEIIGIATTQNKLVLDTVNHTASLDLNYNDGGDRKVSLTNLKATPKRLGFYELSGANTAAVKSFSGYVDFNEGSMKYMYTTNDGLRVVSMTSEVFFLKSTSTLTYNDTTPSNTVVGAYYQFKIMPASSTATVQVMAIVHAKDYKFFKNVTAYNVPFTLTTTGYNFDATDLPTTAIYRASVDSLGGTEKVTDKYPFKTFKADVNIVEGKVTADYMLGPDATVTATGVTYPDYTNR